MHAADDSVDTVCKRGTFSNSEPLKNKVAFMLGKWELACFDKFRELRSNEVSPYIANVEGSEIPQDLSFSISQ